MTQDKTNREYDTRQTNREYEREYDTRQRINKQRI